jgi:hypothetical protein
VILRRRQPRAYRWQTIAAVAALAAVLTCAGCGSTSAPPAAGRPVQGPILGLVTATAVGRHGGPIGVTQYYPVTSRSATAVVVLGPVGRSADATAPLVITWSRMTGSGPRPLFSQRLTVSSYGMAYSTARTAKGALPYGLYQVSASVDGVTKTTMWTVYTPSNATVAKVSQAGQLAAGPSGTFPARGPESHACDAVVSVASMPSVTNVRLNLTAYCPQTRASGPVRGTELATMSRNSGLALVGMLHRGPAGILAGNFDFNVCALPGASDVPGAVIYLSTIIYNHGNTRDFTGYYTLPADHALPAVSLTSSVPAGTPVRAGEKITLRITGTEPSGLGPQTGVNFLRLSGPRGGRVQSVIYNKAVSGCDNSRFRRTLTVIYRVPKTAPKRITLTAIADDMPGHDAIKTITFPFAG